MSAKARAYTRVAASAKVLRDRRSFNDASGVHHGHAVTRLCDHAEVVGDDDDAHLELIFETEQQF